VLFNECYCCALLVVKAAMSARSGDDLMQLHCRRARHAAVRLTACRAARRHALAVRRRPLLRGPCSTPPCFIALAARRRHSQADARELSTDAFCSALTLRRSRALMQWLAWPLVIPLQPPSSPLRGCLR
jgi:hypothetical protein